MKTLKLSLIACIGILLFISCSKKENDLISQNCQTDCTEIVGRIMTDNATVPIPNVKLTVKWKLFTSFIGGGTIRTKAITETDSQGNFDLSFFIRDDEINEGYYHLEYEIDENTYIPGFHNRIEIPELERNTSKNIYLNIPKKAFLNLTVLNLDDKNPGDYFSTNFSTEVPDGFKQSFNSTAIGWGNQPSQLKTIEIPANVPVKFNVVRKINGVSTTVTETLLINAGATKSQTVDFNN